MLRSASETNSFSSGEVVGLVTFDVIRVRLHEQSEDVHRTSPRPPPRPCPHIGHARAVRPLCSSRLGRILQTRPPYMASADVSRSRSLRARSPALYAPHDPARASASEKPFRQSACRLVIRKPRARSPWRSSCVPACVLADSSLPNTSSVELHRHHRCRDPPPPSAPRALCCWPMIERPSCRRSWRPSRRGLRVSLSACRRLGIASRAAVGSYSTSYRERSPRPRQTPWRRQRLEPIAVLVHLPPSCRYGAGGVVAATYRRRCCYRTRRARTQARRRSRPSSGFCV